MFRNPREHKLAQRWLGPAKVTEVFEGNHKYRIESLVPTKGMHRDRIYHASMLQFFDYKAMKVSPEIMRQAQFYAQQQLQPEQLLDLRKNKGEWEIQVLWKEDQMTTWEPLLTIYDYLPEWVESFIEDELPPSAVKHKTNVKRYLSME